MVALLNLLFLTCLVGDDFNHRGPPCFSVTSVYSVVKKYPPRATRVGDDFNHRGTEAWKREEQGTNLIA